MSNRRTKNWTSRSVAMTGAYINLLAGLESYDRRGFMIINSSGVAVNICPNETPTDAASYALPTAQVFDFYDQPPIKYLWVKGASGSIVVFEA